MTLLARRIGNDVSYVMWINDEVYFAWQAQYSWSGSRFTLLAPRIVNDVSYCDEDQAGAVRISTGVVLCNTG